MAAAGSLALCPVLVIITDVFSARRMADRMTLYRRTPADEDTRTAEEQPTLVSLSVRTSAPSGSTGSASHRTPLTRHIYELLGFWDVAHLLITSVHMQSPPEDLD